MNKELYIELLEKKVEDLEKALVTVSDKLLEVQTVKEKVSSDYEELFKNHERMKTNYDDSLELAQIIVDMINNEEDKHWKRLKEYEKLSSMPETSLIMYRSGWSALYELKGKVTEYYDKKVG